MAYVQRTAEGIVKGVYNQPQPGYAEEYLDNDHPEVVHFYNPPPTVSDVAKERTRRLALGIEYDFKDERGVHKIGTTQEDMIGWREVTDYSNALIALGDTQTKIVIVTDTGPTTVTALEWQEVLLHAAHLRQLLWAKSFEIQALTPIPADYADDSRWT